jgi:hypothetical protein
MSIDDDLKEQGEIWRRLREAETEAKTKRLRAFARDGVSVREAAKALGIDKMTAMRYRRKAGLTAPAPLRHLGGGRWVRADGDDKAPRRPFSKGRRGR